MQLILDAAATIQAESWENYLYKILRKLQEFEADTNLNLYNFNNITSSETHDAPTEFTAEISIPCQISVSGVSSQFYLPITSANFNNGTTGELGGLNFFQSIFRAITFLSAIELVQFAEATSRFNWALEKNEDAQINNAIFTANITLPVKHESVTLNGESFLKTSAKEIFF
jgi:hypothetical protein